MYVHVHVTCKVMKVQCKSQMLIACEQTLASFANALIHQSVKPESRVWVKNPNTVYNTRTCLQAKILHVHVNIILVHKSMLMGQLHTYNIKTFMPAINQQQDWVAIATYIIHCVAVLSTISNIEQQLVMVNYACGFNQSEMGKYFEWIIMSIMQVCRICMNFDQLEPAFTCSWATKESYQFPWQVVWHQSHYWLSSLKQGMCQVWWHSLVAVGNDPKSTSEKKNRNYIKSLIWG